MICCSSVVQMDGLFEFSAGVCTVSIIRLCCGFGCSGSILGLLCTRVYNVY